MIYASAAIFVLNQRKIIHNSSVSSLTFYFNQERQGFENMTGT